MKSLPVHWSEGLFLQPHHFQAAERSWTETLQTSEHWDHHYGYGVRTLELSEDAIANYQFQVNVCHARMKDGTIVALDPGQELDRLDLKEAFARESVVTVYLAVPKLRLGVTNVRSSTEKTQARYVEVPQSVQDESSGGNDQELRFRMLDLRLLLSTQDMAGYEVLPLAKIQRMAEQQAAPSIDPTYFPPMLAIDAWPPLGRDIVRAIYDILGQKIEVLSAQAINRGIALDGHVPGSLDKLLKLHELNAGYAVLQVMAFALGIHPLTAYCELCRLVGRLAIFSDARRPPEIPRYDHDDLATIFRKIKALIEDLIKRDPDEPEQQWFEGDGLGMRVALDSRWLGGDWQWFVGVKFGGITKQKCEDLLKQGGNLNWKLASSGQVGDAFRLGRSGLHLIPLPQAPPGLPRTADWLYFEVNRDNEFWLDVLRTQTLAMRLVERTIVDGVQKLQGKRHLVLREGATEFWLEFALFAVPRPRRSP